MKSNEKYIYNSEIWNNIQNEQSKFTKSIWNQIHLYNTSTNKKKEKTLFKKEKKQRTKLDQSKGVHTGEEKPNWMLNNSLSKQAYLNFKKKNFSFIDTP